jgi:hypothetical protein
MDLALSDEGYRNAFRSRSAVIPASVTCETCWLKAPFKDDRFAARYECDRGHAHAAMWADKVVAGEQVLR